MDERFPAPPGMFIDGDWRSSASDKAVEVVNPATEDVIAAVPQATGPDVEAAVAAAREAFDHGSWPTSTPAERSDHLRRFADAIEARMDHLVELTIAEVGTPRALAETMQTRLALRHLRDMVERVLPQYQFTRGTLPTFGNGIGQGVVARVPVGVVAAITPFNYPTYVNLLKLAPALAAGNTVVLKPSPLTPLSAFFLAEAAAAADLPRGVLGVVTGDEEGAKLLTTHPAVDLVSFTGSDATGARILEQAAKTIKRTVLELGGKSANILLADAPLDQAAPHAVAGFTRNAGQGCACLTRIVVHESIHDEVVSRLVAGLRALRVGDPGDRRTDMGPLIRDHQRQRVERYVRLGVEEGARIAFGGGRPDGLERGYFVQPTLLVDVKSAMTCAQDEIFGPVAAVIAVRDDDEAVAVANDSRYGLSGHVWSADPLRAYAVADRLRTGTVTINGGGGGVPVHHPFGGFRHSGIGREFGEAGLEEYLEQRSILWGAARPHQPQG